MRLRWNNETWPLVALGGLGGLALGILFQGSAVIFLLAIGVLANLGLTVMWRAKKMTKLKTIDDAARATARSVVRLFEYLLYEHEKQAAFHEIYMRVRVGMEAFVLVDAGEKVPLPRPSRN
ncbi:MAG: hypothetical protein U0793_12700 [Gemmataceae bacterium]